jgi:heat shock protein HtpX
MTGSLLLRSVVAILLMVAFFSLALGTSAALLYGAYEVGSFGLAARGRGIIYLLLLAGGMGFGGLVVLWSILPRLDRFTPPGPELSAETQPALFKEIHRLAAMTGQRPPAHVYLVADVNAFVTERGGWMGMGSRRVMGLGLGLVNILTVSELRAVIAHEFGHFHGGDTKLGPWIYKTRAAMVRTVQNLFNAGDGAAQSDLELIAWLLVAVGKPFEWFARGYLRITYAISRAQEYSADKVAVTTQGATALIEGLKKAHRGGLAFDVFMRTELGPLINRQYQPPLGEGFRRFMSARDISRQLEKAEKEALEQGAQDPYDTHPPLRERIRHARTLQAAQPREDARPALELLANVPELETILFSEWAVGAPLKRIRWDESAAAFGMEWRKTRGELARGLADAAATAATLPADIGALRRLANRMLGEDVSGATDEVIREWAAGIYSTALCSLLLEHGYTASGGPGEPFGFRRGEVEVAPHPLARRYLAGGAGEGEWRALLEEAGVAQLPLAPAETDRALAG